MKSIIEVNKSKEESSLKKIVIKVKGQKMAVMARKAVSADSVLISSFIAEEAFKGFVLKRTSQEIADSDFFIANCKGKIAAIVGYKRWPTDGIEIISLITKKEFRKKGVGAEVLKICLKEIKRKGFNYVFTLTVAPNLFKKFNFKEIDKKQLSDKAQVDCSKCIHGCISMFDSKCKEIALGIKL